MIVLIQQLNQRSNLASCQTGQDNYNKREMMKNVDAVREES